MNLLLKESINIDLNCDRGLMKPVAFSEASKMYLVGCYDLESSLQDLVTICMFFSVCSWRHFYLCDFHTLLFVFIDIKVKM